MRVRIERWEKRGRTIKLNKEGQLDAVGVNVLLDLALPCVVAQARLRDSGTPRALDLDPVNLGHVRDRELLDHLGRDWAVIVLLRVLDLFRERGEAVRTELGDRLGDAVLLVLLDLVRERGGRAADDAYRVRLDVVAEGASGDQRRV